MKMLKILAIIGICVFAGYMIYTNNVFGAKDMVDPLIATVTTQTLENPGAVAMGAIPTVTAVGGLAWKAVSSIKDRAKNEVNQIAVNANEQVQSSIGQVGKLKEQIAGYEQTNLDLQDKIAELENMPNDSQALLNTIGKKDIAIDKLRTSNQTLMDAIDNIKKEQIVIKEIIK